MKNNINNTENIFFLIQNKEIIESTDIDIQKLRKTLDNEINSLEENNYNEKYEKYTLKHLYLMCEYYKILSFIKKNKYTKNEIIKQILLFENNIDNIEIVERRQILWFYLSELKNDNILKKYIIL
jgi:hypothetical protein